MILNKFRDKNINNKIDKEVVNSIKSLRPINNEKINSILIFTDENVIENVSQTFAKVMGVDISKFKEINYLNKSLKPLDSDNFLTEKDFNWFGEIKKEVIQDLVSSEFDLLINLTKDILLLDYLVVLSKAKFKVGLSNTDKRLYNFMIDTDNVSIFSMELKKYLQILNKL